MPSVRDHTLIRQIGKGAFGRVWLGRSVLGSYRAVKVVEHGTLEDTHLFDREFKGIEQFEPVSRLHDGLVNVLQVGRAADDSYFYYVMELGDDVEPRQEFSVKEYQARTLAAECRLRARVPAPEATLIGAQLAEALEFLHKRGLIHRDIKPSNILYVRGQVRIGDPGLVSRIEAAQSLPGTPGYIPPEGQGTARADIFSLGKLLYVITMAKRAEEFPTLPADMMTYADADDLRRLNLIILRACAHDPKDRYATAEEFRQDLLDAHAGGSPIEVRRRLQWAKRIGMGLVLLLVLIAGGYFRARQQARAERVLLADNYSRAGILSYDANDPLGALPLFAESLETDPDKAGRSELTARRISFTWRYSPRLVAQWYFGHAVNHVAFDPQNRRLAIASGKGGVWLWDWGEPAPVKVGQHGAPGVPANCASVAFSPNGRWLASVGDDNTARFWDVSTQAVFSHMLNLTAGGSSIAFDPQSDRVAIGCGNGQILLTDIAGRNGTYIPCGAGFDPTVRSVAFRPVGGRLLLAGDASSAYQLDAELKRVVLTNHIGWVYELAWNRAGTNSVAAVGDRALLNPALNPLEGHASARLRHVGLVSSVCFNPTQNDLLLTACFDNTIHLWSCSEDEEVMPSLHTETAPNHVTYSHSGELFAVATMGGLVRLYGSPAAELGTRGKGLMVGSGDGSRYGHVDHGLNRPTARIINAISGRVEARITPEAPIRIERLCLDRTGAHVLIRQDISRDKAHFELWSINPCRPIASANVTGQVLETLSPNGALVAFRRNDGLHLWHPPSGASSPYPWHLGSPYDSEVRFSQDSARIAAVWGTNVLVLGTSDGHTISSWGLESRAFTVDLNASGDRVVVGESPEGLTPSTNYVWETTRSSRFSSPLILPDGCFLARFSPDGRWLLLSDESKKATVFATADWRPVAGGMRQHASPGIVIEAAFDRQSRFLATLTGDRGGDPPSARVWDVPSGEPITPMLRLPRPASGSFLAGGAAFICTTWKSEWYRWDLNRLSGNVQDLIDLGRLLSCQQVTPTGDLVPIRGAELQELWLKLHASHPEWFTLTAH